MIDYDIIFLYIILFSYLCLLCILDSQTCPLGTQGQEISQFHWKLLLYQKILKEAPHQRLLQWIQECPKTQYVTLEILPLNLEQHIEAGIIRLWVPNNIPTEVIHYIFPLLLLQVDPTRQLHLPSTVVPHILLASSVLHRDALGLKCSP